ncbi:MAG: recombination-associated protein RdgC [Lentisphaeria bacterium]|nr:recombination-associated protein RdgC [Lentisphaeria bacterium]
MPFDQGNVTFRICALPQAMPDDALERFAANAAASLEHVRDEPKWGWVSARHLLERRIDEETSVLGGHMHLCLRKAERKIPSALLKAECRMEELSQMAADGKETLGRKQRKTIKEDVTERLLPQMPPQLSGTYFTIDTSDNVLYVGAASEKQLEMFLGSFCDVIGFEPVPLVPEVVASEMFEIDPDSIPPLNISPEMGDGDAAGTLGQSFLTWLWFFQEQRGGVLPQSKLGEFSLMVDGPLTFVAEGAGAFESVIRKGMPTVSAEAKAALTVGKKLKQAKVLLMRGQGEEWSLTLDADNFVFRGLKLPEGEAMDPHSVFDERMTNLYTFRKVFFALFQRFLKEMGDEGARREFQESAKQWVRDRDGK